MTFLVDLSKIKRLFPGKLHCFEHNENWQHSKVEMNFIHCCRVTKNGQKLIWKMLHGIQVPDLTCTDITITTQNNQWM